MTLTWILIGIIYSSRTKDPYLLIKDYLPTKFEAFGAKRSRLKCYYAFFLACCGSDTSYIVSVHIQCQASIYTLSLCHGNSWRMRLAKQETLTPPRHLVSPLVSRGPWMSTVVFYCWCHSDSASVLLYFTFLSHLFRLPCGAGSKVPREGFDSSVIMPFFLVCCAPVRTPGVLVENTSSVSPACRKRRLKGRRYIAIVADTA